MIVSKGQPHKEAFFIYLIKYFMKEYNFKKLEKKWQKVWEENNINKTEEVSEKPKCYVLDMFPYPSGDGLHVGHPKGYIATDVYSRFKRLNGYNVLHPMGWDAFGLPAENYALKNKIHPRQAVAKNIKKFKSQLQRICFNYDWEKEINTTNPEYYKWTQWIFLQMYKKGLAYESNEPIIWCPSCKTGLANEDLENGLCERCGSQIEQKPIRQWVLKIREYADRLIDDLKTVDWEKQIIDQQINWIGKSEGIKFVMKIKNSDKEVGVFTTRIDTVFGMTYVVLAPEHELLKTIVPEKNKGTVANYQKEASRKTDMQRVDLQKDKSGVFTGVYAINPFTNKEVPIYIADYVLSSYGTGAVMAVPAHDQRDYEFAKKYDLKIKQVIQGDDSDVSQYAFCDDGVLINSGNFDNLSSAEARKKISEWLEEKNIGAKEITYKLKNWVFSRQRYWGEPIPIIHCKECGVVSVPEDQLPVMLPDVKFYEPTDTGESPLATIDEWVNTKCPKCSGQAKRETNTMPQWAGSCWYYLRYIDNKNNEALVDSQKEKYWMNVDLYVGGQEHATRHLLYARFWHKFLYDIGVVSTSEPFQRLHHVGLILASDNRKMSKRWGNVINPDDIIDKYGADALRVYEMFIGPFDQASNWNTQGLEGVSRFIRKMWKLITENEIIEEDNDEQMRLITKLIKKVGEDIETFDFNTAVSAMMIFSNDMAKYDKISKKVIKKFLIIVSPFMPVFAEELWQYIGMQGSVHQANWPSFDARLVDQGPATYVIQVNGKLRDKIIIEEEMDEEDIKKLVLKSKKVQKHIGGKKIKKIIFIKDKLINFVV